MRRSKDDDIEATAHLSTPRRNAFFFFFFFFDQKRGGRFFAREIKGV